MKSVRIILLLIILNLTQTLSACPVCDNKQPEILQGVSHGSGPEGNLDYIIIACAIIVVGVTLGLSLKLLVWPKESADDHVKHIVVE